MIRHPPLEGLSESDSVRGFRADAGGEEHSHGELSSGLARDEQTGPPTCLRQHRGVDTVTPRSTGPTGSEDSDQPAMPIPKG